ncbi:MAG: GTPase HflX [Chloroflexi bacterium]|nr:GTPase HflX [Chloroflexota bacterium]
MRDTSLAAYYNEVLPHLGERQLEVDRREIRARISTLKKQIEQVRTHRREYRRKRRREGSPTVAIVGYTNAGKSTLLNALTNAGVLVEDRLFATLDPTTRRVKLPAGGEALFTDTVGFIQKLPTQLVAAFRATLEEIGEADLLLHVLDATHPNVREQARAVESTLNEIGAGDKPVILALNKNDLLPEGAPAARRSWLVTQDDPTSSYDAIRISALTGEGLAPLLEQVERVLGEAMVPLHVRIPYAAGDLTSLFHQRGIVEREEFVDQGTLIEGRIAASLAKRFMRYRVVRSLAGKPE